MQDKPAGKSTTVWGALILALIPLIQEFGNNIPGLLPYVDSIVHLLAAIGGFLALFGARKVAGKIISNGKK